MPVDSLSIGNNSSSSLISQNPSLEQIKTSLLLDLKTTDLQPIRDTAAEEALTVMIDHLDSSAVQQSEHGNSTASTNPLASALPNSIGDFVLTGSGQAGRATEVVALQKQLVLSTTTSSIKLESSSLPTLDRYSIATDDAATILSNLKSDKGKGASLLDNKFVSQLGVNTLALVNDSRSRFIESNSESSLQKDSANNLVKASNLNKDQKENSSLHKENKLSTENSAKLTKVNNASEDRNQIQEVSTHISSKSDVIDVRLAQGIVVSDKTKENKAKDVIELQKSPMPHSHNDGRRDQGQGNRDSQENEEDTNSENSRIKEISSTDGNVIGKRSQVLLADEGRYDLVELANKTKQDLKIVEKRLREVDPASSEADLIVKFAKDIVGKFNEGVRSFGAESIIFNSLLTIGYDPNDIPDVTIEKLPTVDPLPNPPSDEDRLRQAKQVAARQLAITVTLQNINLVFKTAEFVLSGRYETAKGMLQGRVS